MAVTGKVFTLFRPISRFSLLSKANRTCGLLSLKSKFKYSTLNYSLQRGIYKDTISIQKSFFTSYVGAMDALSPLDPSSYSRPEIAVVKHISLALNVNFEKKALSGSALLTVNVLEDTAEVILDASNLTIDSIELEDGTPLKYTLGDDIPNFGSKLTVKLPKTEFSGESSVTTSTFSSAVGTCTAMSYDDFCYNIESKNKVACSCYVCRKYGPEVPPDILSRFKIKIQYAASQSASALQWLEPSQTSGKKHPYLFSQCQPIHARSIMPCQDTPAVKFTYDAEVTAPEEFTVLMSAIRGERKNAKATFKQPVPIPSYLLAIAVGVLESRDLGPSNRNFIQTWNMPDLVVYTKFHVIPASYLKMRTKLPLYEASGVLRTLKKSSQFSLVRLEESGKTLKLRLNSQYPYLPNYCLLAIAVGVLESRELGPRSRVWSEKEEVERSAYEFAETEKYLQAAEKICGEYVWTQYDLLVLPPSFPYGGMENPCLTFVTPTLLAGDRSLADVIVHEIMHSWTGNLVTNRNFEHFWLNEGFTVFLERKVGASLIADNAEAKKSRDFHSLLGLQELTEAVDTLGATNPLTKLVVDLKGVHPDDSFSRIPYEKGSLFLRYLEDLAGGPEVFDDFLRSYLNHFARKSLDTDQFKAYLLKYFSDNEKLKAVDWNAWLKTSGMPPIIPNYDASMTKSITTLLEKINQNHTFTHDDVEAFTPHQMIHLLQGLIERPPLPVDSLRSLGQAYKIDSSKNAEIQYRWLRLCVRSKYLDRLSDVFNFVNSQGRMKYVRPVYRDLYAWEEVRDQAINNFLENEKNMMHVCAYTVRKDLHLSE